MPKLFNAVAAMLLAAASLSAPQARAADMVEVSRNDGSPCGEQRFLNKIVDRFSYQVKHVPHLPQVGIVDFFDIREHRYEPQDGEVWPVERTYCKATVALTDGYRRDIWYLIEGGMGFASIGDNVEFCVSGFDRWMVYNGRCRVLR